MATGSLEPDKSGPTFSSSFAIKNLCPQLDDILDYPVLSEPISVIGSESSRRSQAVIRAFHKHIGSHLCPRIKQRRQTCQFLFDWERQRLGPCSFFLWYFLRLSSKF